ncbi:DUF1501 domain-containing protein [Chthonobacter albigriseus]|uniref:DUF1501 domain-containing protein n=1 Tax=Chthonobacter albigriseus TaxID=1683161 RepID=UPI0015EEDFF8|nr:DUF1501 domain-containing protein [Chthonobacter albigriseus]
MAEPTDLFPLTRRDLLVGAGLSLAVGSTGPAVAAAVAPDPRVVVIVLCGGADGLSLVPPVGDPDIRRLRPALAESGQLPLDGFFALPAALPAIHARYRAGEALVAHAVGTGAPSRSHQIALQRLGTGPHGAGWLVALAPVVAPHRRVVTVGDRPSGLTDGATSRLYLPPEAVTALSLDRLVALSDARRGGRTLSVAAPHRRQASTVDIARALGTLLAAPDGPRLAVLDLPGWDTHAAQERTLARPLADLDTAVAALAETLAPVWTSTVMAVVTEFGRTVALNAAGGTDHGTGTAAMILGGSVRGGRVLADWPGLSAPALHEGRDLRATRNVHAVLASAIDDALAPGLTRSAFPDGLV